MAESIGRVRTPSAVLPRLVSREVRPEGLIAGGCSNAGASERVICEEVDGFGLGEEGNRDGWFISGGCIEAIVGKGGATDG